MDFKTIKILPIFVNFAIALRTMNLFVLMAQATLVPLLLVGTIS